MKWSIYRVWPVFTGLLEAHAANVCEVNKRMAMSLTDDGRMACKALLLNKRRKLVTSLTRLELESGWVPAGIFSAVGSS